MGKRLNSGFGACMRGAFLVGVVLLALGTVAADLSSVLAMKAPPAPDPAAYDWSGFYLGGHLGYAWGNSNWTTPGVSGSLDLFQPFDVFAETGSYFGDFRSATIPCSRTVLSSASRPMHRSRVFQI